ncbi:hypothetical protein Hanom_Chr14g01276811 [Helianthus anomalus]
MLFTNSLFFFFKITQVSQFTGISFTVTSSLIMNFGTSFTFLRTTGVSSSLLTGVLIFFFFFLVLSSSLSLSAICFKCCAILLA